MRQTLVFLCDFYEMLWISGYKMPWEANVSGNIVYISGHNWNNFPLAQSWPSGSHSWHHPQISAEPLVPTFLPARCVKKRQSVPTLQNVTCGGVHNAAWASFLPLVTRCPLRSLSFARFLCPNQSPLCFIAFLPSKSVQNSLTVDHLWIFSPPAIPSHLFAITWTTAPFWDQTGRTFLAISLQDPSHVPLVDIQSSILLL